MRLRPIRRAKNRGGRSRRAWFAMLWAIVNADSEERGTPADLSIAEILEWADAYYARTGRWPDRQAGVIPESAGETWLLVDTALALGIRGLPGRSTLARLLAEERGRYHRLLPPQWTERYVLSLADAWHARTGKWPHQYSGEIPGLGGVNWNIVDLALRRGRCGFPGGSSLAQLLDDHGRARNHHALPRFTIKKILDWADRHHRQTGSWPTAEAGPVRDDPAENWNKIDQALRSGVRGLRGGSSLARLLSRRRGVRNQRDLPPLSTAEILAWADAHHRRTGTWPQAKTGPIREAPGESWNGVDDALRAGLRGLPSGGSLARLLARQRGQRNRRELPRLTQRKILAWADAFHRRNGKWPRARSGPIREAPGETWTAVQMALHLGRRGMPGGSSLAQLLMKHRGARNHRRLPNLSERQILAWADAYHRQTGNWPTAASGPIADASGENWNKADMALRNGMRGLPRGSSLARLLARHRGVRNQCDLPSLSIAHILAWADAHHRRTGAWPNVNSGLVPEAPGETWNGVQMALSKGLRGLPGGSSLARLLAKLRGARNRQKPPRLSERKILAWADAYHRRMGKWPKAQSGPIHGAPGETWLAVEMTLIHGRRGMPGGSSLARLLAQKRGKRNHLALPKLRVPTILKWARAHYQRTGKWPGFHSGNVPDAPGERWRNIDRALRTGTRGLAPRTSLHRLLCRHVGKDRGRSRRLRG